MTSYEIWRAQFPEAAAAFEKVVAAAPWPADEQPAVEGKSEAWAQQNQRFLLGRQGILSWRNNVGATPSKTHHTCPHCHGKFTEKQQPVRYGLGNDSQQLNAQFKSSDLILGIPRLIEPGMVGKTILQLGVKNTEKRKRGIAMAIEIVKAYKVGDKTYLSVEEAAKKEFSLTLAKRLENHKSNLADWLLENRDFLEVAFTKYDENLLLDGEGSEDKLSDEEIKEGEEGVVTLYNREKIDAVYINPSTFINKYTRATIPYDKISCFEFGKSVFADEYYKDAHWNDAISPPMKRAGESNIEVILKMQNKKTGVFTIIPGWYDGLLFNSDRMPNRITHSIAGWKYR